MIAISNIVTNVDCVDIFMLPYTCLDVGPMLKKGY